MRQIDKDLLDASKMEIWKRQNERLKMVRMLMSQDGGRHFIMLANMDTNLSFHYCWKRVPM